MAKYKSPVEKDLIKKSKSLNKALRVYTRRLDAIIKTSMIDPKRGAVYWNGIQKQVDQIYADMAATYSRWVNANLPPYYRNEARKLTAMLRKPAKAYNKIPKKTINQFLKGSYSKNVLSALLTDSIRDFTTASSLGNKNVSRYISAARKTTNTLWLEGTEVNSTNMLGAMQSDPSLKNTVNAMVNQRYTQIIDKNGNTRNYTARYYSEIVNRNKWHEAQSATARGVAANYDTDLVRVSSHNTTTEICQAYEAKIMSLSGKDKNFPIADQVPPYHTNCLHFIVPVFIETLRATGTEKQWVAFGSGKSSTPPYPKTYVPVDDRSVA